jgi:hypothetical protein
MNNNNQCIGYGLDSVILDSKLDLRDVIKDGMEVTLFNNVKGIVTYYQDTTASFTLNNDVVSHSVYEVITLVRPSQVLWVKL